MILANLVADLLYAAARPAGAAGMSAPTPPRPPTAVAEPPVAASLALGRRRAGVSRAALARVPPATRRACSASASSSFFVAGRARSRRCSSDQRRPRRHHGHRRADRSPPYVGYPLGTDDYGRSSSRCVVWGARISLLVGFAAALIAMVIGTLIGIASGHYRGCVGGVLEPAHRLVPGDPVPAAGDRAGHRPRRRVAAQHLIIVIGVTSWPATARLVRAQTLSIEARPYLERARALGAGHWHQMNRHVLPNVMPLVSPTRR